MITAVLLILLVIAAIGVIWVVVINFINEGSGAIEGSADCLTTTLSIESVVVGAAIPVPPAPQGSVTVKRTDGSAALDKIKVFVGGTDFSNTTFGAGLGIGQTATLSTTIAAGNKVEVAAVIDGKTCAIADSATAA